MKTHIERFLKKVKQAWVVAVFTLLAMLLITDYNQANSAFAEDTKFEREQLDLVNAKLKQGVITNQHAISFLETMLQRLPKGETNLSALEKLSELYIEEQDFRSGFRMIREIILNYGRSSKASKAFKSFHKTFKNLYLKGGANEWPIEKVITIYKENRALLPREFLANHIGDEILDRMIEANFMEPAISTFTHLIRFRMVGEERAWAGARVAHLHLRINQPKLAIRILNASQILKAEEALISIRRKFRAMANIQLGQWEEAQRLLAGDLSSGADLLRLDIYSATHDWLGASRTFQSLIGKPPADPKLELAEDKSKLVINWALVLQLSKDKESLNLLNAHYGPAMQHSIYANDYASIVSITEAISTAKYKEIGGLMYNDDISNAIRVQFFVN